MPKFRVKVTVTASASYETEVEAADEMRAEDAAVDQWRALTPPDFQVADIDESEAEAEQLTWECEDCGAEISEEQSSKTGGQCEACAAAFDEEHPSGG